MKEFRLLFTMLLFAQFSFGQSYYIDDIDGQTIQTCSGTFYDSGDNPWYADYYANGENFQTTICSNAPNMGLQIDFNFVSTVNGEDTLWIYDGPTATGTPISVLSGWFPNYTVVGYSGCLTFVFSSSGVTFQTGWEGTISCFDYPPIPTQPSCTNIGFENGDFSGWYGTYGIPVSTGIGPISMGDPGDPHPKYTPDVYGQVLAPYHTIQSGAGVDPFGGFPVVNPNGGNFSMMLGDGYNADLGGSSIEQQFDVTAANATMIYSYAIVIQDAAAGGTAHAPEEQPFFKIEAFDCNGDPIPCGDYLVVGGANIPGFTLAPGYTDVYYKPWTDVFLDLTPYIGDCVKIRFTQGDCSLGAHLSYVYLDAICDPLEIVGPQWICPGETVTLEAPPGGAAYSWTPGGQTTQTIDVSPASYTDYSCTVTSVVDPSCVSTAYYWVDVYDSANVTVQNDTICNGDMATLNAIPGIGGGTFSWTPGGGASAVMTSSPSVTTDYTVTYTDLNGCTADATASVVVNQLPTVPVSDLELCNDELSGIITLTGSIPGSTISWTNSNPAIGLAASGNGDIPSFTAVNTGSTAITSTISVTATANGCQGPTQDFTITIHPSPSPVITGVLDYCTGNTASLSTTQPFVGYLWSNNATTATSDFTIADNPITVEVTDANGCTGVSPPVNVIENPSFDYYNTVVICQGDSALVHGAWESVAGTYTDVYTLPSGCDSITHITLVVNPLPNIYAGPDQFECFGVPVTLSASGAPTIVWDNAVSNNVSFTPPLGTSTYIATGTSIDNCVNSDTVVVTVDEIPVVDPIANQVLCVGETTSMIQFTGNLPGTVYSWSNTEPAIGLASSGIGDIASFTGQNNGSTSLVGQITVTPVNGACQGTPENFSITVHPLPNVIAGNQILTCEGNNVILTGSGANTYSWDNNVIDGVSFSPTSGWYTVVGTDIYGCQNTDSVEIIVEPNPIPTFTVNVNPCAPFNAVLTNTTAGNIVDCQWFISNGDNLSGCGPHTYTFPNAGSFDITLTTVSASGCVGTTTMTDIVTLQPNAVAAFSPENLTLSSLDTEVQFTNHSTNAVDYLWDFGDNTSTTSEVNPSHIFPANGTQTYVVTLVAYSSHSGCTDTVSSTVTVEEELLFYVPNTFTPDADDYNEYFRPVFTSGFDPKDFTLYIFNRWGEIVWESHDPWAGWNGTYAGKYIVQDGTYVWKIIFKTKDFGEKKTVVGHVNVLR